MSKNATLDRILAATPPRRSEPEAQSLKPAASWWLVPADRFTAAAAERNADVEVLELEEADEGEQRMVNHPIPTDLLPTIDRAEWVRISQLERPTVAEVQRALTFAFWQHFTEGTSAAYRDLHTTIALVLPRVQAPGVRPEGEPLPEWMSHRCWHCGRGGTSTEHRTLVAWGHPFESVAVHLAARPLGREAQPDADQCCEHGRAMDVHCCNCHGGFLFDSSSCVCVFDAEGATDGDTENRSGPADRPDHVGDSGTRQARSTAAGESPLQPRMEQGAGDSDEGASVAVGGRAAQETEP